MTTKHVNVLLLIASAIALIAWTTGFAQSSSTTETPKDTSSRFQISAWANPQDRGYHHGAFAIDTQTGRIWEIIPGLAPREIGVLK